MARKSKSLVNTGANSIAHSGLLGEARLVGGAKEAHEAEFGEIYAGHAQKSFRATFHNTRNRDNPEQMTTMGAPGREFESKQVIEAQLRATLDLIPAHTWYANPSGALTFVNQRCADYLGLPNEHPLRLGIDTGAPWDCHIPLLHRNDQEESRRAWSTCLRTGCAGEFSFRVRNAEGEYRWFLSSAQPLRASDGNLQYWIGINIEIEERKLAEEGLRQSEEKFRLVLENIDALVIATTLEGELEFVNQQALNYFGKTLEDLKGWQTSDAIHPDDLPSAIAVWKSSIEKGLSYDIDHRFRRSDGVYRWFHVVGRPQRDALGSIARWYVLLTDIDERKRTEEKVKRQDAELRQMMDLVPQLVAVFGPNHERIYANRTGLDYLGVSLEEWRQTHDMRRFVHPDDGDRMRSYFERALSIGVAYELEFRIRKGDGSYRWFLARYNPVHDELGEIARWYVAFTDIEDRKRAEERLQRENLALREEIDKASMSEEIVGSSSALKTVLSLVCKVAPSDSTVLITGETGTGKELVARAIHRHSYRAPQAFISVNCAAIPRDLIASELFGHEKGAFTGATQQRLGRFELASGGTIFLDEIGELPAETQITLLRVLQEHAFERVGGNRRIRADVRVITATNRDLQAAIRAGAFRSDLFYRLHVFPIHMPPLRDRSDDIPLLVDYFIDRYGRKTGKRITSVDKYTLRLLQSYIWPGNVRELQNVIERSVLLCDSETFSIDESWLPQQSVLAKSKQRPTNLNQRLLSEERSMIEAALQQCRGRISGPSGAAARLGIARSTLESKIRSLKINKNRFRTSLEN